MKVLKALPRTTFLAVRAVVAVIVLGSLAAE
jgi:hypothetical protein